MKNTRRAFTLVEMLIVIVIIGILAAALIPRLTGIQGRARDTARETGLTAATQALEMASVDNNGLYPAQSTDATKIGTLEGLAIVDYLDGGFPSNSTVSLSYNPNDTTGSACTGATLDSDDKGTYSYYVNDAKTGYAVGVAMETAAASNKLKCNGASASGAVTITNGTSDAPDRGVTVRKRGLN